MNVLIAGDFCPQNRVVDRLGAGDFASVLGEVKDVVSKADYAIVNFECPVTHDREKPIVKCGPNLQCSEKGMEAIKWAGFDCVTLANNHFLDYGEEGAKNTLEVCSRYGIDTVGGGMNYQEASTILYKELHGEKLAVINCCEHEFSIATETTAGSNPLNPIQQFYAIKEARTKAKYVLVIVHGGHEHFQLPSPRMQETYRFFIDAGADAVVNHHQHCFSGYELYNDKPIFYGLGNFCFDKQGQRNGKWNSGYMVSVNFGRSNIGFELLPYLQCGNTPSVVLTDKENFIKCVLEINKLIGNIKLLQKAYDEFIIDTDDTYLLALEPYIGYWGGLRKRKLLPSMLSRKYFLRLYGFLICESHFNRILKILKKQIYG